MAIADTQARVAFLSLRRTRGVEVEYLPHDGKPPKRLVFVPGSADDDEYGEGAEAGFARDWLTFRSDLKELFGRDPHEDDRIRVATTREEYRVVRLDEPRPWRPSGQHGGIIRIRSILTAEGA